MRPIRRNARPVVAEYDSYSDAKADLVSRMGLYCSYCEREIATVLAVEHIQPKGLPAYSELELEWTNFLLACVNCNSTKKDKDVILSDVLLPDRDNTAAAFVYLDDGSIGLNPDVLGTNIESKANKILSLTGLDKRYSATVDANGNAVALDRIAQRKEALGIARTASTLYASTPTEDMIACIVMLANKTGYFSIWYKVFVDVPEILLQLIRNFPGTFESECFSDVGGKVISPSPNLDGLPYGSKI